VEFHRIIWAEHSERRIAERRLLSRQMVEETLREAEQRFPDPNHHAPDRFIAERRYSRNRGPMLVRVFYADGGDGTAVIVSSYPTFEVSRYWRTDV